MLCLAFIFPTKESNLKRFIVVLLCCVSVALVSCGPSQSKCEEAMESAAQVSKFEDTVEDINPAIRSCSSLDEFKAASSKFPDALDGADDEIFVKNRCLDGTALSHFQLCQEVLE